MPDLPATFFYESQHFAANNNKIAFGERNRTVFDFSWSFDAEESEDDITPGVEINTNIAFREMRVYFEDPAARSTDAALRVASQFAEAEDFRKPKEFREHWIVLPVRPDAA